MSPRAMFFLGVIGGAALIVAWYMAHRNCPECQHKLAKIKNWIGSRMIEPRPGG